MFSQETHSRASLHPVAIHTENDGIFIFISAILCCTLEGSRACVRNYLNRYMATCVPGMEFVVVDEIKEIYKIINNISIKRGKVIFDCLTVDANCDRLRCIDNLYKLFRVFLVGRHKADLTDIGARVTDIDFETDSKAKCSIIVSASRSGKHTYSRYDVAYQIGRALVDTGRYVLGDNANHELAIRADIADDSCSIYKQLTSSQLRFRGEFFSAPGGLRPPIAHCLVRLSKPKSDDVFYDPFCGAGTIAYERSYFKSKKIYASDLNSDVLNIAKSNLKQSAIIFSADATRSMMKDRSVSTVVTNLPWGKQIAVEDIYHLYFCFLKELKRILIANGKAIILTDQVFIITSLCDELGTQCTQMTELSLHGLHPMVFMLQNNWEEGLSWTPPPA